MTKGTAPREVIMRTLANPPRTVDVAAEGYAPIYRMIEQALFNAGFVIVPIEPTMEMIDAGNTGIDDDIDSWNYDSDSGYAVGVHAAKNCWERMLRAYAEGVHDHASV